jgi:hypothetical protein
MFRISIAPFFGDVDTRGTPQGPGSQNVWFSAISGVDTRLAEIQVKFALAGVSLTPTRAIMGTWNNVGYFPSASNFLNTFQFVLAADASDNTVGLGFANMSF